MVVIVSASSTGPLRVSVFAGVRTVVALCALFISACATTPRAPVTVQPGEVKAFELNGRVNVRVGRNPRIPGASVGSMSRERDELWLYSPLGIGGRPYAAGRSRRLLIASDGKEYRAARRHRALRVRSWAGTCRWTALQYWVRGLPWPALRWHRA